MTKDHISINNKKIFPDVDEIDFRKMIDIKIDPKQPKIETTDFLLSSFGIKNEEINDLDRFLRNYIYITIIVQKHLREINNRQIDIKKNMNALSDHGSYTYKKLQYFYKRNQAAKDEIVNFFDSELSQYLVGIKSMYKDLIDIGEEAKLWLYGKTYDYQYNFRFYDPEYDFSTYVKFYHIPGVKPIEIFRNIEKYTILKKESIKEYHDEIVRIVNENNLVSQMGIQVECNYHLHNRKEIFETMVTLFSEGKYLAFISMATIQLEGIFYDLTCIKFGKKERQGTLTEKVEKAFKDNPLLMQTLYPYFAFDIPELRNEIAHKGIVEGRELKQTAYDLVLDLNCVLYLAERASTDKFNKFIFIFKELNKIEEEKYKSKEEYMKAIAHCLLNELYMSDLITYEYFWELLLNPLDYEEELRYYHPDNLEEDEICLKDIVNSIAKWVRSAEFWSAVLEVSNMPYSNDRQEDKALLKFLEKIKNRFIPILNGEAKNICCQVNARITALKT